MEYNVLVPFIFTPTGKGYNEGSTFTTDDSERALILIEKGFLKENQTTALHTNETVLTANEEKRIADETIDSTDILTNLKVKAKALKIKGYTKMSVEQLEEAIAGTESKKVSD